MNWKKIKPWYWLYPIALVYLADFTAEQQNIKRVKAYTEQLIYRELQKRKLDPQNPRDNYQFLRVVEQNHPKVFQTPTPLKPINSNNTNDQNPLLNHVIPEMERLLRLQPNIKFVKIFSPFKSIEDIGRVPFFIMVKFVTPLRNPFKNLKQIQDLMVQWTLVDSRGCIRTSDDFVPSPDQVNYTKSLISVVDITRPQLSYFINPPKFEERVTWLHWAVQNNYFDFLVWLLQPNMLQHQINQLNKQGETPLSLAVTNQNLKIAMLLVKHGANLKGHSQNNNSLINLILMTHPMKSSEQIKLINWLIKQGISINQPDNFGVTPLHWAAQTRNEEIISYLISQGANPDAVDWNRQTPLQLALRHKNTAEKLFKVSNYDSKILGEWLFQSVYFSDPSILELLLKYGANPNWQDPETGNTALFYLEGKDFADFSLLRHLLLKNGINPNIQNFDGLTAAQYAKHHYRASIYGHLKKQITEFMKAKSTDKLQQLFPITFDINQPIDSRKRRLLHYVMDSIEINYPKLEWLLKNGAKPNITDIFGNSPLLAATIICRGLFDAKLNQLQASSGFTPYYIPINTNFNSSKVQQAFKISLEAKFLKLLLRYGANPYQVNQLGLSPIGALGHGHQYEEIKQVLLNK